MSSVSIVNACLMGCALGDSLGLPFENLSPRRIAKLLGKSSIDHRFMLGFGMISDDTEHSLLVARCLHRHPADPESFQQALAGELKLWLASCPAGIGFATLRSLLKLALGCAPSRSGVFSAGNGPAMRSAVIGSLVPDDSNLRRKFTELSSSITHTDPKAVYGASAISEISARLANGEWKTKPKPDHVEEVLRNITTDQEWQQVVDQTCALLRGETSLSDFAGRGGVSGYVYRTVPFAIACWYREFGDFEKTVSQSIRGGGDTDSTTAICGALAGITCYPDAVPLRWQEKVFLWPLSKRDFIELANPGPNLVKVWLRNLFFFFVILLHCMRRCLPPY